MLDQLSANKTLPVITESQLLLERSERLIPSATQTLAKGPSQHVRGVAPAFLKRGKGSKVWDVDDNEYIDYSMAIGPVSLGYSFYEVDEAIRQQLADGITFSLMHPLEVEVAELIHAVVPHAESVRFSKTGADATSAAIRLARAYTNRDVVLCCGYHGWHDWYIGATDRSQGVPPAVRDLIYTFSYNDLDSVLAAIDDDVAAIILEPMTFVEPKDGFLQELRAVCDRFGTLLIFDEMWTGFRIALGGAQEYFGVRADLATFSKAIANGMPLSVLTGSSEIMSLLSGDVFFYTTFGGEALSLAAAKATINFMQENHVQRAVFERGLCLKVGLTAIVRGFGLSYTTVKGHPSRTAVTFDQNVVDPLLARSFVQQEMLRRGILWNGFHNMSYSHSHSDVVATLAAYREVLPILDEAINHSDLQQRILGTAVEPVFRRTDKFNIKPRNLHEVNTP